MPYILGIDLGTSSVKAMLLNSERGVIGTTTIPHRVIIPQEGWAEQNPVTWWESTCRILRQLQKKYPDEYEKIEAVGFSGQMHGLVTLDADFACLRPAILWMDQRSQKQVQVIQEKLTVEGMGLLLHNRAFTGFALSSLLWMKQEEPELFNSICAVLLPKDYIRYKMTGELGTDCSDASASGMFHTAERRWAFEVTDLLGIPREIFPRYGESTEIAGKITAACERETGLRSGIPVVFGCGDQQAQSIGNGAFREGIVICNIGTGGQIATFSRTDKYDAQLRTHTFCHAIDRAYTIFGATLASGMSLNWLTSKVLCQSDYTLLDAEAAAVPAGSQGLLYLPYLSGERTPHMNPQAKGVFFGLQLGHNRAHFARAVMEGVVYSLRDCLEVLRDIGVSGEKIIASGGGAASPLWLQIQADILEGQIQVCKVKEQACLGACIVAGLGTGIFPSVEQACETHVSFDDKVYYPKAENRGVYQRGYEQFRELYNKTAELMGNMLS